MFNAMIHDILGRTHCLTTVPRPALLPGLTCWRMKMIWTCVGRCLHSRSAPRWQLETMLSQRLLLQHPELKGHKRQKSQDYRIASSRRIPRSRTIASPWSPPRMPCKSRRIPCLIPRSPCRRPAIPRSPCRRAGGQQSREIAGSQAQGPWVWRWC